MSERIYLLDSVIPDQMNLEVYFDGRGRLAVIQNRPGNDIIPYVTLRKKEVKKLRKFLKANKNA